MQTRRGRIDPDDIPEDTEVVVLIPGERPVHATDEELAVIDASLAEAREPQRIDARLFLRELRLAR